MTEIELLGSTVHEYRGLLASSEVDGTEKVDMNRLVQHLSRAHDWTEEGARVIAALANDYGTIMLRLMLWLLPSLSVKKMATAASEQAAPPVARIRDYQRRLGELRDEEGLQIRSHVERHDLESGTK